MAFNSRIFLIITRLRNNRWLMFRIDIHKAVSTLVAQILYLIKTRIGISNKISNHLITKWLIVNRMDSRWWIANRMDYKWWIVNKMEFRGWIINRMDYKWWIVNRMESRGWIDNRMDIRWWIVRTANSFNNFLNIITRIRWWLINNKEICKIHRLWIKNLFYSITTHSTVWRRALNTLSPPIIIFLIIWIIIWCLAHKNQYIHRGVFQIIWMPIWCKVKSLFKDLKGAGPTLSCTVSLKALSRDHKCNTQTNWNLVKGWINFNIQTNWVTRYLFVL